MKQKTFFAVATTIFDDGRAIIRKSGTTEAYFKPNAKYHSTPRADRYVDWFASEEEAEEWIKQNTI